MNQHPTIGAEIVAPARQLHEEAPLIRLHHEWFNGSGYPDGVEALDIPLRRADPGRGRCLRGDDLLASVPQDAAQPRDAIGELRSTRGIQFDPEIVPILIGLDREHPRPPAGARRRAADHAARRTRATRAARTTAGIAATVEEPRDRPRTTPRRGQRSPPTMFLSAVVLALIVGSACRGRFPPPRRAATALAALLGVALALRLGGTCLIRPDSMPIPLGSAFILAYVLIFVWLWRNWTVPGLQIASVGIAAEHAGGGSQRRSDADLVAPPSAPRDSRPMRFPPIPFIAAADRAAGRLRGARRPLRRRDPDSRSRSSATSSASATSSSPSGSSGRSSIR